MNIRKGKQYLLYEFDLDIDFTAKSKLTMAMTEPSQV